jgi:hypothetical protein
LLEAGITVLDHVGEDFFNQITDGIETEIRGVKFMLTILIGKRRAVKQGEY